MRRDRVEKAEEAASRRLEDLGDELRLAGLHPADQEGSSAPAPVITVRAPGRHSHTRAEAAVSWVERTRGRVGDIRGRLQMSSAHLGLLALIAAAALVIIAWVRITGAPETVPLPRVSSSTPSLTPVAGTLSSSSSPSSSTTTTGGSAEVVVDVAGKVRHPGVITLPTGSRVIEAIRRAGGPKPGADLSSVNLARLLVDGEQILVGAPVAAGAAGAGAAPAAATGGQVNLNQATLEQLESLPGVGPVTAQKILDYRADHGAFSAVDELLDVAGIGEKTLAELAPHLTV